MHRLYSHNQTGLILILILMVFVGHVEAQPLEARISVLPLSPARVKIECTSQKPTNSLSFRNSYAAILGIGERVERVALFTDEGEPITVRRIAAGEFRFDREVSRFSYEVSLGQLTPSRMANVSWLTEERGLLMLGDLLPLNVSSSTVLHFDLPKGWIVRSDIKADGDELYSVAEAEKAIFYVGRSIREKRWDVKSMEVVFVSSGEWAFSESQVKGITDKLIKECLKLTGSSLTKTAVIMLAPLPGGAGPQSWRAEARGNTVVVLLGTDTNPRALLTRLGVVLSHELLHLWVPNSLDLHGDYDWFFEGFTLYQALRIALRTELIRFEDYLETIGRVYNSYLSSPDRDRLSLIDASARRWTTSSNLIYDKGMLVALICDLSIRSSTHNNRSLDSVYLELFRARDSLRRSDANRAIISLLGREVEIKPLLDSVVLSAGPINLEDRLKHFGLAVRESSGLRIEVRKDLTAQQRNVLRSLGYRD